MNYAFQPDIVQITEQLSKTLNDKKKSLTDLLNAIIQITEIEEIYSKNIEKVGNDLSRIVESSLKDSFTDIIQYLRNYLFIVSEQSKTLVLQLRRDVILELQDSLKSDKGWFNEVEVLQKKHSTDIRRNIDQLNQLQEEYVQALYEEIRFQKNKSINKKHNYQQSEMKLQNYILFYNQYLDTYFQDIAYIQDVFSNVEMDRRKFIQDVGMKFFMFQISVIRNLQYDVASISQKIEQFNSNQKNNEFLILQSDDKPLLSKLNVENYISVLQQQLNFTDSTSSKMKQQNSDSDSKKVDFISTNQSSFLQYCNIFASALKYSNMNNDIIKQLTVMLQKTKPQQYYEVFVSTIHKISNHPDPDNYQHIDCAVTPTTYIICINIINILLDYCDLNNNHGDVVINLFHLSKNIYKLLSVVNQKDENDYNQIKLTLFEGLMSHRILKNVKLWSNYAQTEEIIEQLSQINCHQDIMTMIKKKPKP